MTFERVSRIPRFVRRSVHLLVLTAALIPVIEHGGRVDPRASSMSLPITVITTPEDLVKPAGTPGRGAVRNVAKPDVATEDAMAERAVENRVRVVQVAVPRGFRASGVIPENAAELVGEGTAAGERLATLVVHPFKRDPLTGNSVLQERVQFELALRPEAPGEEALVPLREGPQARRNRERISTIAADAAPTARAAEPTARTGATLRSLQSIQMHDLGIRGGESADYQILGPSTYPSLEGSLVEYLIITNADMKDEFQLVADWYIEQGVPAAVRTVSEIEAAYPHGIDLPERIRLFIRDAYTKWGTSYVLLGGDIDIIPVRLIYNSYERGDFIASDLYYGALDGTWDADGDHIFGERFDGGLGAPGDSIDLFPEVHVGRASVETSAEATIFVDKLKTYTRNPDVSYMRSALFAAQVLFCEDDCIYPEDIILNGADVLNPAAAYVPSTWDTLKLYEWPNGNETRASVLAGLNAGYNLVSFANHGDPFKMSTGDGLFLTIPDVTTLTNNRRFFNLFYLNCQTSEIEAECINEYLMLDPTGGAISVISPTRFDYPHVGGLFIEEFYRLFFQGGVTEVGALQDLMKVPHADEAYWDPAIMWNYTSYILLGDPAMRMWQVEPDTLALSGDGSIAIGDTAYTVIVTAGGSPVANALVTVWNRATGEYGRAYTGGTGFANVPFLAESVGPVRVTATHPAHLADRDSAVVSGGPARLHVESLVIDDDMAGLSFGNADGKMDAGERIELGVTLRNSSSLTAPAGTCTLSVAPGMRMVTDFTVNGVRARGLCFIGEHGVHPAALPCTLRFGGASGQPSALGKPLYVAGTPDDSTSSGSGLVNGRAYLWEDPSGWHLRGAGAFAPVTIQGTLTMTGATRALTGWQAEPSDTVRQLSPTVVSFRFGLGAADEEDGLDLVTSDSSHVQVLSSLGPRASVAPGGVTTASFLVEIAGTARDGERRRLDIAMGTAGRDELPLDIHGPRPSLFSMSVDDSTVSGDKDGTPEPGETVRLWPRIRNHGSGKAVGVLATLRPLTGVMVTDSLDLTGDIPGGELRAGIGGFQLTVIAPLPRVRLEIRDTYGASWLDTLDLTPPAAPSGVVDGASQSVHDESIDLRWNPAAAMDLAGYLVYRGTASSGPFTLLTHRLLERVATYQDEGALNDSLYYYVVTAVDSAGTESKRSSVLAARCRPAIRAGWPKTTLNALWAPPTLADLDGNGTLEILNGSFDGKMYVWNANGTLRSGWPKATAKEIWDAVAVGNLDGDPQLEVVVGSNDNNVYAWNHDGSGFLFPSGVFATTTQEVRSAPTFADLDANGTVEIIAGNSHGRLYAWKTNGTGYLGSGPVFAFPSGSTTIAMSPAVADVDGDGSYEIFYGNLAGHINAYNHNGTPFLASGPRFYTAAGLDSSGFWGSMAIGDLDRNGTYELVAGSWNGNIYAWRMNGTLMPGFPKYIAAGAVIPYEDGKRWRVWSSIALGDIDGDTKLDIVAGSRDQRIYALKYDGTVLPGWPYVAGFECWGGPVLADIDDDGLPEVLAGSLDNAIHAVNGNGTRVPGWPIRTGEDIYASPAVGDIDNDGDIEVVVGSYDGFVYTWNVNKPWRPLSSPWAQSGHDLHNTCWYDWQYPTQLTDVPAEPAVAIPPRLMLAQNTPNPVLDATTIRFGLPRESEVRLAVFDVSGRRVKELARGPWGAGWHELRWDGRDDAGHAVAQGVYFYRLEAGREPLTRKFLIAR